MAINADYEPGKPYPDVFQTVPVKMTENEAGKQLYRNLDLLHDDVTEWSVVLIR